MTRKLDPIAGQPDRSLDDRDISTVPRAKAGAVDRRSFLTTLGTGLAGAAALGAATEPAEAQITDADTGPYADPPGRGRASTQRRYTGITDTDSGAHADQAGRGRGVPGMRGFSDGDQGPNADPTGYGRGSRRPTGLTDSDRGQNQDPPGYGRSGR